MNEILVIDDNAVAHIEVIEVRRSADVQVITDREHHKVHSTITIDIGRLVKALTAKAAWNRTQRSQLLSGTIKTKVVEIE